MYIKEAAITVVSCEEDLTSVYRASQLNIISDVHVNVFAQIKRIVCFEVEEL